MVKWLLGALLLTLGGCHRVFEIEPGPADAGVAGTPFSSPVVITDLKTALEEDDPSLTTDLLEIYILRDADIWKASRNTATEPWGTPVPVAELNSLQTELRPCISADGLTIYFTRDDGTQRDIYVSHRQTRGEQWSTPMSIMGDVNGRDTHEISGWQPDELTLWFESYSAPAGQHDLFIARRTSTEEPFLRSDPLPFNTESSDEGGAWGNADGTIVMFESNRTGSMAIWEAIRDGDTWEVVLHPELDSSAYDGTPWLSPDGRMVVYSSSRNGSDDLFIATR